ncbi:MAG: YbhB/YbcL family Raf kinase inhibitor-like protein, partial [Thermoplasmata archaeon]
NDFGNSGYGGPCPPPGKAHHYYFTIYALDSVIEGDSLKRKELDRQMNGHVIEKAVYLGTYKRSKN